MPAAVLDGVPGLEEFGEKALLAGREILHFAPERQLRERIRACAARHVTADFDRGDCDLSLRNLDFAECFEARISVG